MNYFSQKGNIILFAVVAITAISVLGTGIYFMTTTSIFSGLGANQQNRAYQLAVAGRDYALAKNLTDTAGRDFIFKKVDDINVGKFHLVIIGDTIISTGIVGEGTSYEAKRTITITKAGFGSQADISFAKDIASFSPTATAQAGFVGVDTAAAQISLGQLQASKFGAVWYSGTAALGNCQSGKCDFGSGFRTYFTFNLARQESDIPHGFTFAIFNGADNSSTSAGGDYGLPELLAYGGNSCTARNSWSPYTCTNFLDSTGNGIRPPKIAVEFDGRPNCCDSGTCTPFPSVCKTDFCNRDTNSNSRADGPQTHMTYVFWGDNSASAACSSKDNSRTYDDNRHGAGSATDPVNAVSTDTSDTTDYFIGSTPSWAADWLYNTTKVYAVRIEVTRASTANTAGKYFYTINTWIKRCNSENISDPTACSEFTGLSNTKVAYNPDPADPPILKRTIELDQTFHDKFNKFLFGWTAAAGSASRENLALRNFQLYFARDPVACGGYGAWNNLGGPGTTRYFKINETGCIAVLNGSFIGNIGPNGRINAYTNAACNVAESPSELTYNQAAAADANVNCSVYYDLTDK